MLTADQQLDDAAPPLPSSDLASALPELAALSQKLFGPSVTIESMHDPDAPQNRWIVFHVTTSSDSVKRREQADEWYAEAAKILPSSRGELRLSIMPRA